MWPPTKRANPQFPAGSLLTPVVTLFDYIETLVKHMLNARSAVASLGTTMSIEVIAVPAVRAVAPVNVVSQQDVLKLEIGMAVPDVQVPSFTQ